MGDWAIAAIERLIRETEHGLAQLIAESSLLWGPKLGLADRCRYLGGDMFKEVPQQTPTQSADARQHKFAPRVGLAVVQAGQREEGHPRYVLAARFDL